MAEAALMILVGMLLGLLAAVTTLFVYLLLEAYDKQHHSASPETQHLEKLAKPDGAYSYNNDEFRTMTSTANYYRAVQQMQHQTGSMYVG